jgi:hypothetical protein
VVRGTGGIVRVGGKWEGQELDQREDEENMYRS